MSTSTARTRTWSRVEHSNGEAATDGPKRKKQKLNPDLQSAVTIDLPPEIVLQIFELLPRNDLLSASLVCSQWQQVSNDERLRWHTLFEIDLIVDIYAGREIARDEQKLKLLQIPSEHYFADSPLKIQHIMSSENKKAIVFPEALKNSYSYGTSMSLACLIFDSQDPSSIIATRATKKWLPDLSLDCFRYFVKLSKNHKRPGVLTIEMHPKRIEKLLRQGKEFDELAKTLAHRLLNSVSDERIGNLFDSQSTYEPAVLPALSEQPEELIGVKFHNYQLKALNWMLATEKSEKVYAVSPLFQVERTNLHMLIQQNTYQFVLEDCVKDYDITVKPKGGVLADEMGLGKTITMIGLMLANPMKDPPVNKPYFTTKATLVFCPNHLVQQWKKEIETHCTNKLKIVVLTTINQIKKCSYQDVMDADVVIASYNLLQNKNYLAFPDSAKDFVVEKPRKDKYHSLGIYSEPSISDLTAFKRAARVDKVLQDLKDNDPKTIKGVILDHFHWHRVIMDEGHELINDMSIGRFSIIRLQKTYAWYMSGTPFPTIETVHNARKLVGFDVYPCAPKEYTAGKDNYWGFEEFYEEDYSEYDWSDDKPVTVHQFDNALTKLFMANLIWRNTKASIVDEYKMTEVTEKYKILTLTPIEQAIYEDLVAFPPRFNSNDEYDKENSSKSSKLPPQYVLCQRLREEWGDNLTEIRQHFIDKKEDDILKLERLLQSLIEERNRIKKVTDLDSRKIVDTFAAKKSEKLGKITKCQEIKKMFEDAQPVKLSNKDCLEGYIERHGTKLGNLVDLLKKIFIQNQSTGVIVFSRFSPYLRKIAQVLAEYSIPSSFVEGNVFSKTNAMTKFKTSANVKVILMNLEKSASGANLIEASHVLLMEPLEGDPEYIKATERQAIGRAQRQGQTEPVTVTRFLVKDTVEHTSYLQHYGTNTPNNSDTTINQSPGKGTLVRSGSFSVNITKGENNDEEQDSAESDSLSPVDSMEGTDESSAMD